MPIVYNCRRRCWYEQSRWGRRNRLFGSCFCHLRRTFDYVRIVISTNTRCCFDLFLILVISIAYCLNRFCLKNIVDIPAISYILKCHFNDFLAGIGIIAYLNLLFAVSKYRQFKVSSYTMAISLCFVCGMLWEYVFPLLFSHGTSDILDVLSYMIGGMAYIRLLRIHMNGQSFNNSKNWLLFINCKEEIVLWWKEQFVCLWRFYLHFLSAPAVVAVPPAPESGLI